MASTQDITVDQGTAISITFTIKNADGSAFDLTGYSAEIQVRSTYTAAALIDASTANGRLVLSAPASGALIWNIDALDTPQTIRFGESTDDALDFLYDLKITSPSGKSYRPVEGTLTVSRAVTHT